MELVYKITNKENISPNYNKEESPLCAISNQNIIAISSLRTDFLSSSIENDKELVLILFTILKQIMNI